MNDRIWFERSFTLGHTAELLAELLERLRGTPARLEERLGPLGSELIRARPGERWSIQEHAGHLADLERLWLGRVDDLEGGAEVLREADLENTATWEAGHNDRPLGEILNDFRTRRALLVERVEGLAAATVHATALHPRLRQPMTVSDLCFFIAEHDDHHLATITRLLRESDAGRAGGVRAGR